MGFEGPKISTESSKVDPRVLDQIREDLKALFRGAKDPLAVLLQTMETKEFKDLVPVDVSEGVKAKLRSVAPEYLTDADMFAQKIVEITLPVLEITKKGKTDSYKQEGREMYSEEDMVHAVELAKAHGAKKIYVVGNVGSGKTTFARELSRSIGVANIDVDAYFPIFRQEHGRDATDVNELLSFILQREKPPFVVNHADLLRLGLTPDADMVVYLAPKKEEQLASRAIREERGAEGEWRGVREEDYDHIIAQNSVAFDALAGDVAYSDPATGTSIKVRNT